MLCRCSLPSHTLDTHVCLPCSPFHFSVLIYACSLSVISQVLSFPAVSLLIVPAFTPSVFTDFKLDFFPCLNMSAAHHPTNLCLRLFFFSYSFSFSFWVCILFLSVGHQFFPPFPIHQPTLFPAFCPSFVSPSLYLFASSSFHPTTPTPPFLCLSACRCRMCAATFFSKSDMQIHSKSHTEAKPHKCPHCAKSFANSSYLAQHIRIHSGAKPYTCSYCQKSFRQLSHLQQHTRYCRPPVTHPRTILPVLLTCPAKPLSEARTPVFFLLGKSVEGCRCWLACCWPAPPTSDQKNLTSTH